MRRLLLFLCPIAALAVFAAIMASHMQAQPPSAIIPVVVDPSGSCFAPIPMQYNSANGKYWGCENGTWTVVSGGGGAGNTPWTACPSGCTTTIGASPFSVSTSTHGQGAFPSVQCFLPTTPLTPTTCTYTQDALGNLVFTYSGSLGQIQIQSAGNSGASGSTGATGATGPAGAGAITIRSVDLGTSTGNSTRIMGTAYHNTNSGILWISASCQATGAVFVEMEAVTDSSSTPTTAISLIGANEPFAMAWLNIVFPVLAGDYYEVVNVTGCGATGSTGTRWYEWH